ncbi:hypothetical protein EST38_g13380, partial [Candolleomyces aberdarensis]
MAPSASKQKRLAEKAAKQSAKLKDIEAGGTGTSTPTGSTTGTGASTPLTSMSGAASKNPSQEDLLSMARLNLVTDRSAAGVLVSDVKGRDIKMDAFTLSFHGRLLIEGAEVSLNYGNRYGLLGE